MHFLLVINETSFNTYINDVWLCYVPFAISYYVQDGFTPLLAAASAGHADVVDVLLQHGANVDHQDKVTTVLCNHC